jgi:phage shock protein A
VESSVLTIFKARNYNLDCKNPHVGEQEVHDPDVLLAQYAGDARGYGQFAEQHRIVAKVDELMALCDQLETQHNNAAEAHEKMVSVLLQALTQSADCQRF